MKPNPSRSSRSKRAKRGSSGGQGAAATSAKHEGVSDRVRQSGTSKKMSPEIPPRPSTSGGGHAGMSCAGDAHHPKLRRVAAGLSRQDSFSKLSLEITCHILSYLPLRDVVRLESLSRSMHEAVTMHLRLLKDIDFTEGEIYGWMAGGFTDVTFAKFLQRCPDIVNIYGASFKECCKAQATWLRDFKCSRK